MKAALAKFWRLLIVLLLLALGIGAERIGLVDYFSQPGNAQRVMRLLRQHMYLVAWSMLLATTVGMAVGILFTRRCLRDYAGIVMYVVGLGQTIPSLAVLALVMSFMGLGARTAIFALFVYSILPIARNTLAGITSVPPSLLDAAKGMGMPAWRILLAVELPNAMSVILTGFRIALVINIGTAALASLIGAGGLGDLVFTGIAMQQSRLLLAGAIPVTLLALLGDLLCEVLRIVIIPRGLRLESTT